MPYFFLFLVSLSFAAAEERPKGLVLTWQQDPTTTMTIDWHTAGGEYGTALRFRPAGGDDWTDAAGASHAFPYSDRRIHRIELTGLAQGAEYEFLLEGFPRTYRFQTMPADIVNPMRIAVGGDVRHNREMMERTNRAAMARDPHFIVWGGDLAYANADPRRAGDWHEFFDAMMNTLITPAGRVTPVVVILGNHEVFWRPRHENEPHLLEEWGYENHEAVYFHDLFAYPRRPGYGTLDFGNYLSLILLNSDHGMPIPGEQAEWLERELAARTDRLHVIPVYHVPAYPSVRDFDGWASPEIREHWVPLFEKHGVKAAFEHHDHAYKRTHPILEGKIHERGIVFIGDGAWGVGTREIHPVEDTWYLARAEEKRHFILLTLQGRHQHFLMIDEDGQVFDEYPAQPRRAE